MEGMLSDLTHGADSCVQATTAGNGRPDGAAIAISAVTKRFGNVTAVDDVTLSIRHKEFFSLLGPSGCGKTTLLRMIAGFERPSAGRISLAGRDVTHEPVRVRDLNLVFQNYALFPHLSVFGNVAFELRVRRVPRKVIRERVREMLSLVQLDGYAERKPSQLSGGQRQRVALARALVGSPAVLLLDEPLGALDQKLRQEMQLELKRVQREVGITFVYVTHDQEEALTMSDRIGVMRDGRVLQVDDPRAIYEQPKDRFVAGFIGQSNFLDGDTVGHGPAYTTVRLHGLGESQAVLATDIAPGERVTVAIRPERVRFLRQAEEGIPGNTARGTVGEIIFVGNDTQFLIDIDGTALRMRRQNDASTADGREVRQGDQVTVTWNPDDARILVS